MMGDNINDDNQKGIIPRVINNIFTNIQNNYDNNIFIISINYIEI